MKIQLPPSVDFILNTLNEHGFEAYIVGGCVRDYLSNKTPVDYDICTNATPNETKQCFKKYATIDTGMKHGTVTVLVEKQPFEVTSYRKDGAYSDSRRPDNVCFVNDLCEDLIRRDFTINAMAYNHSVGLVDNHEGLKDLEENLIRAVGNPETRFKEDALRIMRALRFASVLNFKIEYDTANAINKLCYNLKNVSQERISGELSKLLVGDSAVDILLRYSNAFAVFIPELHRTIELKQNHPYHNYSVYEHMVRSLGFAPPDLTLRLTMFLHDIEKPSCHSVGKDGTDYFYGHEKLSAETALKILKRLRYDNRTVKSVQELILIHGIKIVPNAKDIKRWLNKIGDDQVLKWIKVRTANISAQDSLLIEKLLFENNIILQITEDILQKAQCYNISDLNVTGDDLIEIGINKGPQIGKVLSLLLELVIDEEIKNDRESLINKAKTLSFF